jgi:hypothetical protein
LEVGKEALYLVRTILRGHYGSIWLKLSNFNSLLYQIWEVKKELEKQTSNSELVIRTMVHEMKGKIKKYWDLSYLNICIPVILDPRFKLKFLEFRLNEGFGTEAFKYLSKVEKTFRKLFAEYSLQVGDSVREEEHSVSNVDLNELDPLGRLGTTSKCSEKKKVNELDWYLEDETVCNS